MAFQDQDKAALTHVVNNVFGFKNKDFPLYKALIAEGIETLLDMLTLPDSDIDKLIYHDDSGTTKLVPEDCRDIIRAYRKFWSFCRSKGIPMDDIMWVTQEDFNQFCQDPTKIPTRIQLKAALAHVLDNVFGFTNKDHPLRKALTAKGINTLVDMLTMKLADIDALTYDDSGTAKRVLKGHLHMIKSYKDYVRHVLTRAHQLWTICRQPKRIFKTSGFITSMSAMMI